MAHLECALDTLAPLGTPRTRSSGAQVLRNLLEVGPVAILALLLLPAGNAAGASVAVAVATVIVLTAGFLGALLLQGNGILGELGA